MLEHRLYQDQEFYPMIISDGLGKIMQFANHTQKHGAGERAFNNISYTLLTLLFFSYSLPSVGPAVAPEWTLMVEGSKKKHDYNGFVYIPVRECDLKSLVLF